MKLFHLSDLHIGKRVNEFSMIEDQKYILSQILHAAKIKKPDGILLSGDIYDSTIPSAEAVQVFDAFLTELSVERIPAFIISGNHDSAERLAFGSSLMGKSGIYFSRVYDGTIEKIPLQDAYGTVWIHLLPFLRPAVVRHALPERAEEVSYAADAVRIALEQGAVDENERNVLLAHQFVTGAKRCEAEELQVGDLDQIPVELFERFDYVALGHIHSPQKVGSGDGALLWIAAQIFFLGSRSGKIHHGGRAERKRNSGTSNHSVRAAARHAENPGHVSGSHGKIIL